MTFPRMVGTKLAPLNDEELELQRVKGLEFRALIEEACGDLLESVSKPAIFLSGGMDSTATLWGMLKHGAKPVVITFATPGTDKMSRDASKAKVLADHYGLEFHLVTLPAQPDYVAQQIERLVRDYPLLKTRADYEVSYILDQMFIKAAELGCDSVFTGACDASIHMLSRDKEIQGRAGKMSLEELELRRVELLDDSQFPVFVALAAERQLMLCAPIHIAASTMPYRGVPWHIMNMSAGVSKDGVSGKGLNKAITIRAYEQEMAETDVLVRAQPLQCGDTGSREYFDTSLTESQYADQVAGREVTSSNIFINSMLKLVRDTKNRADRKNHGWDTWRRVVLNQEPVNPAYKPGYQVNKDGRAEWPLPQRNEDGDIVVDAGPVVDDEEDLFGDIDVDQTVIPAPEKAADPAWPHRNEAGEVDRRVDCWGVPMWEGPTMMNGCERALAGLCGHYQPTQPWQMESCEAFEAWVRDAVDEFRVGTECIADTPTGAVYQKWAERTAERLIPLIQEFQLRS